MIIRGFSRKVRVAEIRGHNDTFFVLAGNTVYQVDTLANDSPSGNAYVEVEVKDLVILNDHKYLIYISCVAKGLVNHIEHLPDIEEYKV